MIVLIKSFSLLGVVHVHAHVKRSDLDSQWLLIIMIMN